MGDYQKELALEKLQKATEMIEGLTSGDLTLLPQECQNELRRIIELIAKAKEHIANV